MLKYVQMARAFIHKRISTHNPDIETDFFPALGRRMLSYLRRLTVVSKYSTFFLAAGLTTALTSVSRSIAPHLLPGYLHSHRFLASPGGRLPLSRA